MSKVSISQANPALALLWHPSKNGDVSPDQIAAYSNKKFWWVCDFGHESETRVSSAMTKHIQTGKISCRQCKSISHLHPGLAAQWHPTKNEGVRPDELGQGSTLSVWWLCDLCDHEWKVNISNRVYRGDGCPACSGRVAQPGSTDLATTRPDIAARWHPTLNGDLTAADVKQFSNVRVWWTCDSGHDTLAKVSDRSNGAVCRPCYRGSRDE